MSKPTDAQRRVIMAEVEQVMLAGKWCLKSRNLLADRHNLSTRTIAEYKHNVQQQWLSAEAVEDVRKERAQWKVKLSVAQQAALAKKDFRALASLLRIEASVGGFDGFAIKQAPSDTPMTEQEAVGELSAVPKHLLEAALAALAAKRAQDE